MVLFHLVSSIFSGGNGNPNEMPSLPTYFQICIWHPSNPYWRFTELLIIPPTDSAGSSNLTTGIAFCLLWMHSFAVLQNLPLPTLSHVILVWSILDKDHYVWTRVGWTVLLPHVPSLARRDLDTSCHWSKWLFLYARDVLYKPSPLSRCPSLFTSRITIQESVHMLLSLVSLP